MKSEKQIREEIRICKQQSKILTTEGRYSLAECQVIWNKALEWVLK